MDVQVFDLGKNQGNSLEENTMDSISRKGYKNADFIVTIL